MLNLTKYLLAATGLFALASGPAFAASVCPVLTGGNSNGFGVAGAYTADDGGTNGGCNVLITFNANGSITTTNPNGAGYYDTGGDDNEVGIINNTGSAISSINLSSTIYDPFAFDGDGVCGAPGYTVGGGSTKACSSSDASGYGLASITFTNINASGSSGTVNFGTPIAAGGGTAFFSLEDPVDVNLSITTGGAVPEPNSLVLLGTGILGVAGAFRRKLMS